MPEILLNPPLEGDEIIPKYEFVQDIEENAEATIVTETPVIAQALVKEPINSYWYFQLETESGNSESGNNVPGTWSPTLGASSLPQQENISTVLEDDDTPPIAKPGSFQLFLPDPEMMDRVGQVHPDEIYQRSSTVATKNAVNNAENYGNSIQKSLNLEVGNSSTQSSARSKSTNADTIITKSESLSAIPEVPQASNRRSERSERPERSESKARVTFAENPVSGRQSPPRSKSTSSTPKLVSYQKPRKDRSRSRNSRIASATQQVNRYIFKIIFLYEYVGQFLVNF